MHILHLTEGLLMKRGSHLTSVRLENLDKNVYLQKDRTKIVIFRIKIVLVGKTSIWSEKNLRTRHQVC